MQTSDTCLFCLCGAESDRLIHNVRCRCNYTYHRSCFDRYDRKQICPLCKNDVGPPPIVTIGGDCLVRTSYEREPPPDISDIAITIAGPQSSRPPLANDARSGRLPGQVSRAAPQPSAPPTNTTPLINTPIVTQQTRIMNALAALGCLAIIITLIVFVANLAPWS